jgi:hypothetical protein
VSGALLSQRRRAHAYHVAEAWIADRRVGDAADALAGLPVQLRLQGLATVLALALTGRGGRADIELRVADALAHWLLKEWPARPQRQVREGDAVRAVIDLVVNEGDLPAYMAWQAEAIAFCEELKTFATGLAKAEAAGRKLGGADGR